MLDAVYWKGRPGSVWDRRGNGKVRLSQVRFGRLGSAENQYIGKDRIGADHDEQGELPPIFVCRQ